MSLRSWTIVDRSFNAVFQQVLLGCAGATVYFQGVYAHVWIRTQTGAHRRTSKGIVTDGWD